jgi:hypothetical protein
MYVRWKKRPMTLAGSRGVREPQAGYTLSAVIAECRRIDGRPRQRFIAHLATLEVWENGWGDVPIGSGGCACRAVVSRFWRDVARKLDASDLACDRDAVKAMIARKVPPSVESEARS